MPPPPPPPKKEPKFVVFPPRRELVCQIHRKNSLNGNDINRLTEQKTGGYVNKNKLVTEKEREDGQREDREGRTERGGHRRDETKARRDRRGENDRFEVGERKSSPVINHPSLSETFEPAETEKTSALTRLSSKALPLSVTFILSEGKY